MRALGAELIVQGKDFDEAREHCEQLAAEHGYRYVHSGDEPLLIAGVGTETLEIFEDLADVDAILVPIGGGSGAAGACVVAKPIRPETEVIGVQSEAAPPAFRSWQARALLDDEMATSAEGLATRVPFELPQTILIEPAGAAPLAAALKLGDRLRGERLALVASGGNLSPAQLADLFR